MQSLKVRKIEFAFDADIPFQAFPQAPEWGNLVNVITLIAPAFERYFIKSIRQAIPEISDRSLRENAEAFCAQEAQHAKHHLAHLAVLSARYPGLADTEQSIRAAYNHLYQSESQDFHLGYAASVELLFGPIAKFVFANIERLFRGSDERIASFIFWHLAEEFEHRNSAIDIYNHVVGNYSYRVRTAPKVFRHILDVYRLAIDGIRQQVYADAPHTMPDPDKVFSRTSFSSRLAFFYQLFSTLLPWHDPVHLAQPDIVTQWFLAEDSGVDVRNYFSKKGFKEGGVGY